MLAGRRDKIVDTAEEQGSEATIREHLLNGKGTKAATAFVSIMQGCNQYCTFCIVPYTRGEERSRTIPDIVSECRVLVAGGVKEITLLGQIVTSYGKRGLGAPASSPAGGNTHTTNLPARTPALPGKSAFVQLIEAVHEIEGLERIRFTSPHPKGYGDDLIEAFLEALRLRHLDDCWSLLSSLDVRSLQQPLLKPWHTYLKGILAFEVYSDWAEAERTFAELLQTDLEPAMRGPRC